MTDKKPLSTPGSSHLAAIHPCVGEVRFLYGGITFDTCTETSIVPHSDFRKRDSRHSKTSDPGVIMTRLHFP